MIRIKEQYGLNYDKSEYGSGLIDWYNKLIDKTYDDLNTVDVSKMLRQNILKDVAMKKAIDLFIQDPFTGEYNDGDLLSKMVAFDISDLQNINLDKLKNIVKKLTNTYSNFDWINEEDKERYCENLYILYSVLMKL